MISMNVEDVKKTAVIGAGYMGLGQTLTFAKAGYPVAVVDITEEALKNFMERLDEHLKLFVRKKVLTQEQADASRTRINPTLDLAEAVGDADYVQESTRPPGAREDLDIRRQIFENIEVACPSHTIIGSSGHIPMDIIAKHLKRRERCLGVHWVSPPWIAPLVEICPGEKTLSEIINVMKDFLVCVGKVPIVMNRPQEFKGRLEFSDPRWHICNPLDYFFAQKLKLANELIEKRYASAEDVWKAHKYGIAFRGVILTEPEFSQFARPPEYYIGNKISPMTLEKLEQYIDLAKFMKIK
jgi:hypothetical protein